MAEATRELVVLMTRGTDHELSSVAFTIANGGITAGLKVYAFLTSSAVDLVRRRAADTTQVAPLEPLKALIDDFQKRGGTLRTNSCGPWYVVTFISDETFVGKVCFSRNRVIPCIDSLFLSGNC